MKLYISAFFCCLAIAMIFYTEKEVLASGEPVTVDVEGYASIVGGRKDTAREGALNNAFRRAIEQVVGVMVNSKTVVQDSALLNDKILSKSSGFIKTYKIISEHFETDACRVNVKATVSTIRLEKGLNDVGLLSQKLGKPRIAIIMTEQNIGNDGPSGSLSDASVNAGISESILHDVLRKKGYNLVDRETLVAIARREGTLSPTGGAVPTEAALQVAAGGGAEVVIIGQAVAKAGASAVSGTNIRTSQANVSARVVDADTGQLVASHSTSATAAHVNPTAGGAEALKRSAQELAENLNRQIVAKWSRKVAGTRT
ncbi:MAG: flagellar assembly protein T N-terminal domain-containing protein, partial [Deltaproteobacteria bacterium]